MNKLNATYEKYLELKELPSNRKAELSSRVIELQEQEQTAQKAFTDAENDGKDSSQLFTSWQTIQRELSLAQARYKAIDVSRIGSELPRTAQELQDEANRYIATLDKEKAVIEGKMQTLKESFLELFYAYADIQAEQTRAMNLVNNDARKLFKNLYVSPNFAKKAEDLPFPTIEIARRENQLRGI